MGVDKMGGNCTAGKTTAGQEPGKWEDFEFGREAVLLSSGILSGGMSLRKKMVIKSSEIDIDAIFEARSRLCFLLLLFQPP